MRILLLSLLTLVIINCTKQQTITIYTINIDKKIEEVQNSLYRDKIVKIAYPKGIMGRNIIFNYQNNQEAIYQNGIWSNSINRLIISYLHHTVENSKLFKNTIDYSSYAKYDYILESSVSKLYHKVRDNSSQAILSIKLDLIDIDSHKIVKSKKFNYEISTSSKDLTDYIKATQKVFNILSIDLIDWLKKS